MRLSSSAPRNPADAPGYPRHSWLLSAADFLDVHLSAALANHAEDVAIGGSNFESAFLFSENLCRIFDFHAEARYIDHESTALLGETTAALGTLFGPSSQYNHHPVLRKIRPNSPDAQSRRDP